MNMQARNVRIPVVIPGAVGEQGMMRILTNNPKLETQKITLKGYGLRIQPLELAQPDYVQDIMKKNWGDNKYPGAITIVKAEGEEAPVNLAFLTPIEWLTFNKRSNFWNFQADYYEGKERPSEGWYRPSTIPSSAYPDAGVRVFLTETLVNTEGLQRLPEGYLDSPEYKQFVEIMERQAGSEIEWPEVDFERRRSIKER